VGLRGVIEGLANAEETRTALLLAPRANYTHGVGALRLKVTSAMVTNSRSAAPRFPCSRRGWGGSVAVTTIADALVMPKHGGKP
jgi:hypothetical protein